MKLFIIKNFEILNEDTDVAVNVPLGSTVELNGEIAILKTPTGSFELTLDDLKTLDSHFKNTLARALINANEYYIPLGTRVLINGAMLECSSYDKKTKTHKLSNGVQYSKDEISNEAIVEQQFQSTLEDILLGIDKQALKLPKISEYKFKLMLNKTYSYYKEDGSVGKGELVGYVGKDLLINNEKVKKTSLL